jgi:hypothetical protein
MTKPIPSPKTAAPTQAQQARIRALDLQELIDNMLHGSLEKARRKDNVEITITRFQDVLATDKELDGNKPARLCDHLISLNGRKPVSPKNKLLGKLFKKSTPKTIKITVVDGETPKNQPKHIYYPIGIAFRSASNKKEKDKRSEVHKEDFENGRVYLFGETMFLTINREFDFEHLKEYAVIVQRDDTRIGVIDPPVINYL